MPRSDHSATAHYSRFFCIGLISLLPLSAIFGCDNSTADESWTTETDASLDAHATSPDQSAPETAQDAELEDATDASLDTGPETNIDALPTPSKEASTDGSGDVFDAPLDAVHEADSPSPTLVDHRGIWVWGASVHGHESEFIDWANKHQFTDVFLLIKGISGTVNYGTISPLMNARTQKALPIRIWAWIVGFDDQKHASWTYLVNDRVSPADTAYRAYLASVVRNGIDPSKGKVPMSPDGVILDDTFGWPSHNYGGSAANRISAISAGVDASAAEIDAVRASTGKSILLGIAPLPETSVG
jgi:hypothetical protein